MNNYGNGVSRVLDPTGTQYTDVILQQGKPPLDAEFNLLQDLAFDFSKKIVLRGTPSGWLGNETNPKSDFTTNPIWSNWFKYGPQRTGERQAILWAVVNGWLIPVTGTRTGTPPGSPDDIDTFNVVALDPPPGNSGDFRIDFAFLEVWLARIPPNPATLNKPAASAVWRYGNVEGGFSFLADDIIDPAIGFETSERVQLQYRIRVVDGLVGLTGNPDGFDPTVVKAQGAATTPTSFVFTNMRQVLNDPGLWRAGDGTQNALGTVDGYVYAVPVCAVFRRNSIAWNGDPSQNLNGGFNRNPTAVDRTGIQTFSTTTTLAIDLSATATTAQLVSAANIPLPLNPATAVLIQIGDELLTYAAITTGVPPLLTGLVRGTNGSRAELHRAGTAIKVISGRPDGLFSDQIATTDILDLRHAINPNGFDYQTLLQTNLDKLVRGQLRANWKRSGAGPQGPFVFYQDKITTGSVSLGVTKLDAFDGIRQIFSDAATAQRVECTVQANSSALPAPITAPGWQLSIAANQTIRTSTNTFSPGDAISIPVAQLKAGLPGGDADQVRWLNDGVPNAIVLRIDGQSQAVPSTMYTVTPANPGPNDDLLITLGANFAATSNQLYITLNALFGPGRGLSRRPDSLHSVAFLNPATDLLVRPQGIPSADLPTNVTWLPLWSKYRNTSYKRNVPVASEAFADNGSKTVVISPFRRISMASQFRAIDGTAVHPYSTFPITSSVGSATGTTTFTDTTQNFTTSSINPGDTLILTSGPQQGRFQIQTVGTTTLIVDRALPIATGLSYQIQHVTALVASPTGSSTGSTSFTDTNGAINYVTAGVVVGDTLLLVTGFAPGRYTVLGVTSSTLTLDRNVNIGTTTPPMTGLVYLVAHAQGLMPLNAANGATAKWTTTDPLGLFSGTTESSAATKNIFVNLPRHLVPGWGGVRVPILPSDRTPFAEGVNFMSLSIKGIAPFADGDKNYVPYNNSGLTYAIFSTLNFNPPSSPAVYNAAFTFGTKQFAGMRKFTDSRGLSRVGLELPPFYGIARLFAVYEATNYASAGSAYDPSSRNATGGGAVNLLRQNMNASDGPTFWVEIDADGDSTFILNANALDLSRSPTAITFNTADFVIEASIFGFDRGAFDITREFRMVLTRPTSTSLMRNQANDTNPANRYVNNVGAAITGPTCVLPGPAVNSDQVVINYTRTPYQGDPWGSQTNFTDISYNEGPLTSGTAFQVVSTKLDENNLTRPNQKILEVLASVGFATTLGTGRISGDVSTLGTDIRDVGYENMVVYPPSSSIAARPVTLASNFVTDSVEIGTEYQGASERLPLGALFRDKDFRGGLLGSGEGTAAPIIFFGSRGMATSPSNVSVQSALEQSEILLETSSVAAGAPGDLIVQVDGEQGNYSLVVNFRTLRGGSAFSAGGAHPGGEVTVQHPNVQAPDGHSNVIEGRAFLVRNYTTSVGANEVSPGGELMMLIVTNISQLKDTNTHAGIVSIGTNGTGEGFAAADLFRIDGHPMLRDNVRLVVDPTTILLSKRSA